MPPSNGAHAPDNKESTDGAEAPRRGTNPTPTKVETPVPGIIGTRDLQRFFKLGTYDERQL